MILIRLAKGHWQLMALTALVFAFWSTQLVFPLKIFVIFLHELSHALAAWLTGGSVAQISLDAREGGLAVSRGGNGFIISSAGYLGSLLLGVALFLAALRSRADRAVMASFGIALLLITAVYFRTLFEVGFGVATGTAMLLIAYALPRPVNDLLLRIIGLTSMIYVPYDIFNDIIARSGIRSDARILAETYGGPTLLWGGIWLILSLIAIGSCLRYGIGNNSNLALPGLRRPKRRS